MTQLYAKFIVTNLNSIMEIFMPPQNVNMQLEDKVGTSFIGPSGCGKSTSFDPQPHAGLGAYACVEGLIELGR